jgi:NADH:ubiquinone oxidoreductase subunit 2 (subunit N)
MSMKHMLAISSISQIGYLMIRMLEIIMDMQVWWFAYYFVCLQV